MAGKVRIKRKPAGLRSISGKRDAGASEVLPLRCPICGRKLGETVGELETSISLKCPRCRNVIRLGPEGALKEVV